MIFLKKRKKKTKTNEIELYFSKNDIIISEENACPDKLFCSILVEKIKPILQWVIFVLVVDRARRLTISTNVFFFLFTKGVFVLAKLDLVFGKLSVC